MQTWFIVGAEEVEFAGILRQAKAVGRLEIPNVAFVREISWHQHRWILIANGPGPRLVQEALRALRLAGLNADVLMSIGFCGALDPTLRVGDIVISGLDTVQVLAPRLPYVLGQVCSVDRVVVTKGEKQRLHEESRAAVVEMESAAVVAFASQWNLTCHCVRVVSDSADHDMPLDFNTFRDQAGRFSRARIALAALARPFTAIPALLRLDANCRQAATRLGEFLAHCEYK